jgi:hypothetical protein
LRALPHIHSVSLFNPRAIAFASRQEEMRAR